MNLSQANPTPKQLNLNKLSDAGGSQIHWQVALAKTDSSSDFGIMGLVYRELLFCAANRGHFKILSLIFSWSSVGRTERRFHLF